MDFEGKKAPLDDEGFVASFSLEESSKIREFFDEFGFVVIRDILTEPQANDLISGIWDELEAPGRIKRDQISTWSHFPEGTRLGILGSPFLLPKAVWETRQLPRLHQAFSIILQSEDLLVSNDRVGLMRPTKNIAFPDGTLQQRPNWGTAPQWAHWDMNPWEHFQADRRSKENEEKMFWSHGKCLWKDMSEADFFFSTENNERPISHFINSHKVQGLISLNDSREDTGGFICCPGFHQYLPKWIQSNPKTHSLHFVPVGTGSTEILSNMQKITMRKGSLCIWSAELPHCNYPNESNQLRACVYVKMFPKSSLPLGVEGFLKERTKALLRLMPPGLEVTDLGRRLFALDCLSDQEKAEIW